MAASLQQSLALPRLSTRHWEGGTQIGGQAGVGQWGVCHLLPPAARGWGMVLTGVEERVDVLGPGSIAIPSAVTSSPLLCASVSSLCRGC